MKLISIKACGTAAACMISMLFFTGCSMKEEATKVSTDVAALQDIVNLDITPASAKWEVFGTPEYIGGVPGSTDFVTLIAELTPVDEKTFAAKQRAGKVWIAPESARSWLANSFHSMLDKEKNLTADLSTRDNCRAINTTLKQTNAPVRGFACSDAGKILLYLTIADNSAS